MIRPIFTAFAACMMFACASKQTPVELTHARNTVSRAEVSAASRLAEQELALARVTLQQAERAHEDDAGSLESRHLAYLAGRRAELAITEGNIQKAHRSIAQAERAYTRSEESIRRMKQDAVDETRAQLDFEAEVDPDAEVDLDEPN